MIINTNKSALNSYNNANRNSNKVSASMEKLASGLKINKAGDDAAGLAISEKMRAQIRGLQQAQENIQNGISLLNVAEGGMAEQHSLLQRIRELSVQASNDTYTDTDRKSIQIEVDQLMNEIDGIANGTEYNGMKLLAGEYDKEGNAISSASLAEVVSSITLSNGINDKYPFNGKDYASAIIDFSNLTSESDVAKLAGKGAHLTCATCSKAYSIKFVTGTPDLGKLNSYDPIMEVSIDSVANGSALLDKIFEAAYGPGESHFEYNPESPQPLPTTASNFVRHFSKLARKDDKLYIYDDRLSTASQTWPTSDRRGVFEPSVFKGIPNIEEKLLPLNIQVGSNAGQSVTVEIPNTTVDQIGLEGLLVTSNENANLAISKVDWAINRVSNARSTVGVFQNRFEHAYSNASLFESNLTASESRIRDSDVSKEIVYLQKQQILLQSSQSMMAQAGQITQGILQMLKG